MRDLYQNVEPEMTLRDRLALDRTDLANRRTWLATARTSLALFVSGATFVRFFDVVWLEWLGGVFMAGALPIAVVGWLHFERTQREYRRLAARGRRDRVEETLPGSQAR